MLMEEQQQTAPKPRGLKQNILIGVCAALVGFINGLFGAGGGMLVVVLLTKLIAQEQHRAQATAVAIMLPVSLISAVIYIFHGVVDWGILGLLCIGTVTGALLGAKVLHKFSSLWLKRIFGGLMIVSAVRMLWPLF